MKKTFLGFLSIILLSVSYTMGAPDLRITEVYTNMDERVEITNISLTDTFSGDLIFDGAGVSGIVVDPGKSILLLRSGEVFPYIVASVPMYSIPLWFHDNDACNQTLTGIVAGTPIFLDSVVIDTGTVTSVNGKNRTLQRLRDGSTLGPWGGSTASINITDPSTRTANPGVVFSAVSPIAFPPIPPSPPTCPTVSITELHRADGFVGDYFELSFGSSFSGTLDIAGTLLTPFSQAVQVGTGAFFVIGTQGGISETTYQQFPGFLGISGVVVVSVGGTMCATVTVDVIMQQTGQSRYPGASNFATGSPGVFLSYLPLFPKQTLTASGCQAGFPLDCFEPVPMPTSGQCQVTFPLDCFEPLPILTTGMCQTAFPTTCFNPPICVATCPSGQSCQAPQSCPSCNCGGGGGGSCPSPPPVTLGVCQALFSGCVVSVESALQTGTLITMATTGISGQFLTGDISLSSGQRAEDAVHLRLTRVEYDPPGTDTNNEKIGIALFTGPASFFFQGWSIYDQYYKKTRPLISTTLLQGSEYITTGGRTLINSKPNCVELRDGLGLFHDKLCYDPANTTGLVTTGYVVPLLFSGTISSGTLGTGQTILSGEVLFEGSEEIVGTGTGLVMSLTGTQADYVDDNLYTGQILDVRFLQFAIVDVVYDPTVQGGASESITIRLLTGAQTFSTKQLRLRINDNKTLKTLSSTGVLQVGQDMKIAKNFGFPNEKSTEIRLLLLSGGVETVYATYFYQPASETDQSDLLDESERTTPDVTDRQLRIRNIIYDPPGKDTANEQIVLELTSGEPVSGTLLRLRINGKTIKKLPYGPLLKLGFPVTFTSTFGFPNTKETCVDLLQNNHVFDTLCYSPPGDDEEKTDDITDKELLYSGLRLKINNIVYDPSGKDEGNETITLSFLAGQTGIDLSDGFYLLIGSRKQSLRYFGWLELGQTKTYTGSFRFPNDQQTCVSLVRDELIYDTYCYGTLPEEQEKTGYVEPVSGEVIPLFSGVSLEITTIDYDPPGADQGKESLSLRLVAPRQDLLLTKSFYLTRQTSTGKTTKRSLAGHNLSPTQVTRVVGNWGFPNTEACVDLRYTDQLLDTYCYEKTTTMTTSTKKSKSTKIIDATDKELRLARAYIAELEATLRGDWMSLRYNSSLWQYASLYRRAKEFVKQGKDMLWMYGLQVSSYDLQTQHDITYGRSPSQVVTDSIRHTLVGTQGEELWWTWRDTMLQQQ